MAKSHFAIERPRKISISIEGYDAKMRTQQQLQKQQERHKRMQRKSQRQAQAEPAPVPVRVPERKPSARAAQQLPEDDTGLQALNAAASAPALDADALQRLQDAFGLGEEGGHADE